MDNRDSQFERLIAIDPINHFFQQQLTSDKSQSSNITFPSLSPKSSLQDIVIEFLRRENWEYTITKNPLVLRMICQGQNGQWRCYAHSKEVDQQFIFYSVCPVETPPAKLSAIAEYISRANYGMTIGNFELDFNDGEIRYKTSTDVGSDGLSLSLIKQLVYTNILTLDRYLPGIVAVIEEDIKPSAAISSIESP